ncbi:MAG: polysaccharide biosynthesis tyrosine autokinase [Actinomycetota bacterium]|nr:polysaccharide biosynthesis tyrosine autokinase [Actinomycetota bacterium]
MQASNASLLGFRDYLRVLSRRRNTIIFAVFVVATIALASALVQTPQYVATSSVLIKQSNAANLLNPNGAAVANNPAMQLQTQIDVITSLPVKQAVEAQLGSVPPVTIAPHGQAAVIDISAQSTDPPSAAVIANAFANAFIRYSQTQDINAALAAEALLQTRIDDLQKQIDALNSQIKGADSRAQAQANATLGPQVSSLLQQQATFKQQLSQIQVQAAVSSGDAQLASPATIPNGAVTPRPVRDLVLAILAGLMLGVGAAFALEYFDDSVKSRDDLDRAVAGTPNIGLIPQVPGWKDKSNPMLVTLSDPNSPAAEAYRALRTSLQFVSLDRPLRTVLITSPSAGEGKTTILSNLGVALAQVGQRVIITCCDLRRPRLHEFFGLDNSVGFTSALLGEVPVFAALQQVEGVPNLRILASGPLPVNPSELLSTERAAEVLAALQAEADIILIDSPPILPVTDAAVLTRLADATLLVVTVGSTTRRHVSEALEVLGRVEAPLLGTVLNNISSEGSYSYVYRPYYAAASTSRQPEPPHENGDRGQSWPPTPSPTPSGGRERTQPPRGPQHRRSDELAPRDR